MKNILVFILLFANSNFLFSQNAPTQLSDLINKAMNNYPKLKEAN